jgi:hypothetical protein
LFIHALAMMNIVGHDLELQNTLPPLNSI